VQNILVTGGAGFIESQACKALAQAGYTPVSFDSIERGHRRAVKWGPLQRGDFRNEADLRLLRDLRHSSAPALARGRHARSVNPYGRTKLIIERMLVEGEVAHLHYFSAAGADPDGELGESHEPETHLIPLVLFAAMGRRPSIQVFGNYYPTPDGTCIRDYRT
jgi:UDP-arabinose 4-epimerase